jgi:hypothetical protein
MRSAVLQPARIRTVNEHRQVLRAAIRQLERADLYLAAVVNMDLDDGEAYRALFRVQSELESLRRYLVALRTAR